MIVLATGLVIGLTGCDTGSSGGGTATTVTTSTLIVKNNGSVAITALYIDPYVATYSTATNPLGTNQLGSSTVSASGGSITLTSIPAGDYSVRLRYAGLADGSFIWYGNATTNIQAKMTLAADKTYTLTFKTGSTVGLEIDSFE